SLYWFPLCSLCLCGESCLPRRVSNPCPPETHPPRSRPSSVREPNVTPTRLTLLAAAVLSTAATARAADFTADFTADVRPVLAKHCASCHGPDKQRGGLRLDSASAVRQGGNSGPAIV